MRKLHYLLIGAWLFLFCVTCAQAQVSVAIGMPSLSIGISIPVYPKFERVPNYPVYYAPRVNANYFFYDGLYWVFHDDTWYASSWYDGPWGIVEPDYLPLYILRIPVRYYRQPPAYFRGWVSNAPPRWGQRWGYGWEQRRSGWNRWNRNAAPAPAPLPTYQRQYVGEQYPRAEEQRTLRSRHYQYQPRNSVVRQHFQQERSRPPAAAQQPVRQAEPPKRVAPSQQEQPRVAPAPQPAPVMQQQQMPPAQQRPMPRVREREREQQERGPAHQQEQRRGQDNDDDRGRGRGRGPR